MIRFKLFGLMAVALLTMGVSANADDIKAQPPAGGDHAKYFHDCAKACDDCARTCDICAAHCTRLVADGQKHHIATLKTCQDCAAVCRAASTITAKMGPFSDIICLACADCCKRCGDACEQHGKNDPTMKACAEECRKCEKACRDMLKRLTPAGGQPAK